MSKILTKIFKNLSALFLASCLFIVAQAATAFAQEKTETSKTNSRQQTAAPRNGQHDFDWELGNWNVEISRLQKPLTGSTAYRT